jgi:tRNA A37 threonylcarbamoyladenosine biosynthesis protein TsaE
LIGVIGDAGAGKSQLIQGMFPGLELSNDDQRINVRPLPLLYDAENGRFDHHTYHLDMLFELAFSQPQTLAEAVSKALVEGCRVVVEHFEVLYQILKINAHVLVGIGEEVIIARPELFGPYPDEIRSIVYNSLHYRKMAHSAEDLTQLVLMKMGIATADDHGDVRHGFMLCYSSQPHADLDLVERLVLELIAKDQTVSPSGETRVIIGDKSLRCTGPRIHVRRTGDVKNFRLRKDYVYDPFTEEYGIVGLVGEEPHSFFTGGEKQLIE